LWVTSDTDLLQIGARQADHVRILKDVFRRRAQWFRHVYRALKAASSTDRRRAPRHLCDGDWTVRWEWRDDSGQLQCGFGAVRDFSQNGLAVVTDSPRPGSLVTLSTCESSRHRRPAPMHISDELLGNSTFRFAWQDGHTMGLARVCSTQPVQ
jgi:hypothetical protein